MAPVSASTLLPPDRASFATSSRLLSCLIAESLLKAIFIPACGDIPQKHFIGTAVVLTSNATSGKRDRPYSTDDIFAIIPLRRIPIFKPRCRGDIGLLDPLDMLPYVYKLLDGAHLQQNGHISPLPWEPQVLTTLPQVLRHSALVSLTLVPGPLDMWKRFADDSDIDNNIQEAVAEELCSSVAWQQYSYEHPPTHAPTFDSPSIVWEQCIIEGHPTHPMHRARRTIPPIAPVHPGSFDWERPLIRLVAVPRASVHIQGAWDDLLVPVCEAAAGRAKKPIEIPDGHTIIPLHILQVANIREKFPEARILPEEYHVEALAQQSLRSVLVPSALPSLSLKLAMGVRLATVIRTIFPPMGPRFSSVIIPRLTYDRSLLVMQRELASVVYADPDPNIAKHLAGIVREVYENTSVEAHGERVIVCTALVETGYGGGGELPLVQLMFGLNTEEKRMAWFDKFVDIILKAFLPPVITNGVIFEIHPQNTLARFDIQTRELKGFVIRDFCGTIPSLQIQLKMHTRNCIMPLSATTCSGSSVYSIYITTGWAGRSCDVV